MTTRPWDWPTRILVGILAVAGGAHFAMPKGFDDIVPHVLPGAPRMWTYLSGVAELGVAATVALRRTRHTGGALAAVLFVAVFPANVQMAIDWTDRSLGQRLLAYGRLPLQIPLVWLAIVVMRRQGSATGARVRTQ